MDVRQMAAGPFTCSEDVEYEPLRDLLKYAVQQHADLVVLLGPFVDTEHPAVKTGALDVTFEDLFANTVRAAVEAVRWALWDAPEVPPRFRMLPDCTSALRIKERQFRSYNAGIRRTSRQLFKLLA